MQQIDWLNDEIVICENDLDIRLIADFISAYEADNLLEQFIETVPWQQPRVQVYGKWHPTPRLIAFYGDSPLSYSYSATLHGALPWTPGLSDLRARTARQTGANSNAVLLNYYRDGRDTMGWHADDEKELGTEPVIASLSLGATRDILFRPRSGKRAPLKIALPSGSLLIMRGKTQQHWQHHVPKRTRCTTPRINLTFRNILDRR